MFFGTTQAQTNDTCFADITFIDKVDQGFAHDIEVIIGNDTLITDENGLVQISVLCGDTVNLEIKDALTANSELSFPIHKNDSIYIELTHWVYSLWPRIYYEQNNIECDSSDLIEFKQWLLSAHNNGEWMLQHFDDERTKDENYRIDLSEIKLEIQPYLAPGESQGLVNDRVQVLVNYLTAIGYSDNHIEIKPTLKFRTLLSSVKLPSGKEIRFRTVIDHNLINNQQNDDDKKALNDLLRMIEVQPR